MMISSEHDGDRSRDVEAHGGDRERLAGVVAGESFFSPFTRLPISEVVFPGTPVEQIFEKGTSTEFFPDDISKSRLCEIIEDALSKLMAPDGFHFDVRYLNIKDSEFNPNGDKARILIYVQTNRKPIGPTDGTEDIR